MRSFPHPTFCLALALLAAPPAASAAAAAAGPREAPGDLASAELQVAGDRLLVNLMVDGRLAWFSWMKEQRFKPRLLVEWTEAGRRHTKTWQHGAEGSEYPQVFFLQRGDGPGHVLWAPHELIGATREGHKHNFFSKGPTRCGFVKADLSEIPPDATITRAELVMHIHNREGLKAGPGPEEAGTGHFRHVNKDWDWNHMTFTHYAEGKPWTTPTATYPFWGDGDLSPVLWSLDRQKDLAARGYHKSGQRDYPLDLTAYVHRLQELRTKAATAPAK